VGLTEYTTSSEIAEYQKASESFSLAMSSVLDIKSRTHYRVALQLVEALMDECEDVEGAPLAPIIDLISTSIERFEDTLPEVIEFENNISSLPDDLSVLRVLMDQHKLALSDLPEVGSKSMVSRVLSGERQLSKNHIQALSERFGISPAVFF